MRYLFICVHLSLMLMAFGPPRIQKQPPSYPELLRLTADTALRLPAGKDVRVYYCQVTRLLYNQALAITRFQTERQSPTTNIAFFQTLVQLLTKLRNDLRPPAENDAKVAISASFQRNLRAALQNFRRYQQPSGLNDEQQYRWIMTQLFENLNQINIGYLQERLTPEEKKQVWQRIIVQQQIAAQLKTK